MLLSTDFKMESSYALNSMQIHYHRNIPNENPCCFKEGATDQAKSAWEYRFRAKRGRIELTGYLNLSALLFKLDRYQNFWSLEADTADG